MFYATLFKLKPIKIFLLLIGLSMFLILSSCQKNNFDELDFTPITIDTLTTLSIDSLLVIGEVKDLEKLKESVRSYGIIWTTEPSGSLTISNFEENIRIGALSRGSSNGQFKIALKVEPDRNYQIAAYATPDNDRYFYSEVKKITTGTGSVFTEDVYYESQFNFEMRGKIAGVEKGLSVVQHGFCWSTTNQDPKFEPDTDTVQLRGFSTNGEFKYEITVDKTSSITPYYIRSFAVFTNSLGEETTVFGNIHKFHGDFNFWIPKTNYPGAGRVGAAVFVLHDKAYVGSGWEESKNKYRDFYIYDPLLANDWNSEGINFAEGQPPIKGVGFALGNNGYIGVGNDISSRDNNVLWKFTSTFFGNTWVAIDPLPTSSTFAPFGAVSFTVGDSIAYYGTGKIFHDQNYFFKYNPRTNKWTPLANFIGGNRSEATGFAIAGKGYIGIGGVSDMYEYDPSKDEWTQKADFPGEIRDKAIGFALNGKGYVGGGHSPITGKALSDFWEFDPSDSSIGLDANGNPLGSWIRRSDLPHAFYDGISFIIDNRAFVGLGRNPDSANQYSTLIWEYNP